MRRGCCDVQWRVQRLGFRSQQLRRVRKRLRRTQSVVLPGSLHYLHGVLPGGMVRRRWLWWGVRLPKRDVLRIQLVLRRLIARQSVLSELLSVIDTRGALPGPTE